MKMVKRLLKVLLGLVLAVFVGYLVFTGYQI